VISQTTQPIDRVRELVAEIERLHPASEVRFVDTVCKPTKDRQSALRETDRVAEVIVFVGGRESNNTLQLVETVAQQAGARFTLNGRRNCVPNGSIASALPV
jgi:4-hydroxy-3-methylbut-2-enyl diphosphate reductase